jgi:L-threonylcarbamoyladenylate synthase
LLHLTYGLKPVPFKLTHYRQQHDLHHGWCCVSFRLYDVCETGVFNGAAHFAKTARVRAVLKTIQGTEVRFLSAEILRVHPDEPQPERIEYIVSCLRKGDMIAIPTDTFYGLAVDPVNLQAVERIYQLKTRQKHKPLSLLISGLAQAYELARDTDPLLDKLADKFWPGPLTIIVRAGTKLPLRSTANTGNVALRVPDAAIARAVVERFGLPITATSANLQGASECTHAACVRDQIGDRIPLIVDGGPTGHSLPTTIVDLSLGPGRWEILREGAIPTHEIVMVLQR